MKKIVSALLFSLAIYTQAKPQNIQGIVLDENDAPIEFATVTILYDSLIMDGGITDKDGKFDLCRPKNANRIKVSMIGYRTAILPVSDISNYMNIRLDADNVLLDGVTITAILPKTEIKGDAVVTNVTGSVLEHSGNALDVLAKIPGMIERNGNLEVLGRGTPEYYINGRKATDNTELRNLMSEDIKSIEVINNSGALYGGNTSCIVRISTAKRQGDGLSFALTSQSRQRIISSNDFEPSWSVLDINYRKKGLDLFGKIVCWNRHNYQSSNINSVTHIINNDRISVQAESGTIDYASHNGGLQYAFGTNWQINERHSLGFKIDIDKNNRDDYDTRIITNVLVNNRVEDHLDSYSHATNPYNGQRLGNLYYDGNIGKTNVNFNADFVEGRISTETITNESSTQKPAEISSSSKAKTCLGATKLVISHPVGNGKLQAGAEETYVVASQEYNITKSDIPSADATLTDNTIAGFAQYSTPLPFGQISLGLRFEHADMDYDDFLSDANSIERHQNDWFPSFSFASAIGEIKYSLTFTGKTIRPAYNMLSNEITYNNRYAYQRGNPKLQNEKNRTLSINANWKWITFSSNIEVKKRRIVQWASPYGNEGVVMIEYSNLDKRVRQMSFFINASPTIGKWSPRYTAGLQKQILEVTVDDPVATDGRRKLTLNKPLLFFQAYNSFHFWESWVIDLNYEYASRMNQDIYYISKPIHKIEASIQKSFFDGDALTIRLTGTDLLNKNVQPVKADCGSYAVVQTNDNKTPSILLRLAYRFNSASNKYKGTGAGLDAKSRM